ncbi:hypothetical protein TNCV_1956901 [Trichonephila clavipes]|nr:hypothetical protein TNCV_1956901 [Trichonephila clavipes]
MVTEVFEQMFRSGGQSDVKPPVFSSQASMSFLNEPVPDDSSEYLDILFTTSPFLLLKNPVTVFQGISLLSQTGSINGYTTGLCTAYYDYNPTDIEDQNPNDGQ